MERLRLSGWGAGCSNCNRPLLHWPPGTIPLLGLAADPVETGAPTLSEIFLPHAPHSSRSVFSYSLPTAGVTPLISTLFEEKEEPKFSWAGRAQCPESVTQYSLNLRRRGSGDKVQASSTPSPTQCVTNFTGGTGRPQTQQRVARNSFCADINNVPPCEKAHPMEPGWHGAKPPAITARAGKPRIESVLLALAAPPTHAVGDGSAASLLSNSSIGNPGLCLYSS